MTDKPFIVKNGLTVNGAFQANGTQVKLGTLTTTSGVEIDLTSITIGNSSVNATINSTAFSGTAQASNTINQTANNTNFVGSVSAANVVSNGQLQSNLASFQTIAGMSVYSNTAAITGLVATLTSNTANFIGSLYAANVVSNAQLQSNLTAYQTTAGLSANVAKLSSNNASYLGGVAAAVYVNTSGSYTITGVLSYAANLVVSAGFSANGSFGSNGYVLTSNGTAPYWAQPLSSVSNTQLFVASDTWTKPAGYTANSRVFVQLWGAGGSGGRGSDVAGGGGGGPYREFWFPLSALGATETVTVGVGAAGVSSGNGAVGGTTSFGTHGTAYGGGAGLTYTDINGFKFGYGGTGGAWSAALTLAAAGVNDDPGHYGYQGLSGGQFMGGGGGYTFYNAGTYPAIHAGGAQYGGGGGGGANSSTASAPGISFNGGNGGVSSVASNGSPGFFPAGGGGAATNSGNVSGGGANGQVIITVFPGA